MGRIPPEYLPPPEAWSERVYTLPELRAYPQHLNSTEELLDRHVADGRGDRAAILFEAQRITYAALAAQVNCLAGALRSVGIGEEDRALPRAPSIPPALVDNFAVIKLGAVIESVIARHPAVADCCVIGVSDAVRGQNTRAYVALGQGVTLREGLEREIVDFCRDALAVYKLPREVVFVDSAPRAPGRAGPGTGKLLRRVLRDAAV